MYEPTIYEIDAQGIICHVDGGWARFASANGGGALTAAHVIGRPLAEFMADHTTREIYDRLMQRALQGHRVEVPFRCDSPGHRRWMRLQMTQAASGLRFEVRTEREQAREPVALLDPGRRAGPGLLSMCSWCKRVAVAGEWLEVEAAIETLGLFESSRLPRISHGICPECLDRLECDVA